MGREEQKKKRRVQQIRRNNTMLVIITIVVILLTSLIVGSFRLLGKIRENEDRLSELSMALDQEEARTGEIDALKEYMQTDEYIEKTAREKFGMVKDNEILFKEEK